MDRVVMGLPGIAGGVIFFLDGIRTPVIVGAGIYFYADWNDNGYIMI